MDESPSDLPTTSQVTCQDCWDDPYAGYGYSARSRCCTPLGWARAEYLWWRTKGNDIPALVTTSPPNTPQVAAGVLPDATVLFGNEQIDNDFRSGLRINVGRWLDECQDMGLEVVWFSVFDDNATGDYFAQTTGGAGSGTPILARPFFDPITGNENASIISYPGRTDGLVNIESSSEMHSLSLLLRRAYHRGPRGRVDLIGGYRYFRYREGLMIDQRRVVTDNTSVDFGTQLEFFDSFLAENDFHGGDLGFVAEFTSGPATLELLTKVALGNLHRTVTIDGSSRAITPVPPPNEANFVGGLLALGSNIGQDTDNDFAVLPEFGVNLKYELTDCFSLMGGYTLVMLNDVVRSGEQFDRVVDARNLPPNPIVGDYPERLDRNVTDFWVHGLSIGAHMVW